LFAEGCALSIGGQELELMLYDDSPSELMM